MLKLIGAVFILFAGAMFGFYRAGLLAKRPKQIRQLVSALQRLETEIVFGATPLAEAFAKLGSQLPAPVGTLFAKTAAELAEMSDRTAGSVWRQAVEAQWGFTAMKRPEQDVLIDLSHTLGRSDRDDQVKHLRLAMARLASEETAATEEQAKYERMWKSLGLLMGALVVILMY